MNLEDSEESSKIKTETNRSEHMGGAPGHSHKSFLALKPDIVVAYSMGPGALNTFQKAGIPVLEASASTVKGNIKSFKEGKLKKLERGCEHANQHEH